MTAVDKFLSDIQLGVTARMPEIMVHRSARTNKVDGSFVTKGDLLVNDLIRDVAANALEPIQIVSEESPDDHLDISTDGFVAVVDPIDGTENFTSGLAEWGVSVSCYKNGVHAGSLLGCPEMNLWVRSGDEVTKFTSRIRGLSSSMKLDDLMKTTVGYEYRILGCCVYNMINVIRGSFRSFENLKGAHSWDILGGLNLALEHNLKVTVNESIYHGEYLQANRKYRFSIEH